MITEENEKDFSNPTTGQPSPWQPLDYPIYTIPIGINQQYPDYPAAKLKLVASSAEEAGRIAKRILEDENMQDVIKLEVQTINIDDAGILRELPIADSSTTPFQKMTSSIKVCGSEFNITYLDNAVYKAGSQGGQIQQTGQFDVATKNNNNYIYRSSLTQFVASKISKAIEKAYSNDDINKDVKSVYANRLAKAQSSITDHEKIGTRTSNVFQTNTERDEVIIANWNDVATASRAEMDVPSCTRERPSGEIIAQDLIIKVAA
jgi:hypothetical protein